MNEIFDLVYSFLVWLSAVTGLTYKEVNVVAYYMILPTIYLVLVDRILRRVLLTPVFALGWCGVLLLTKSFARLSDRLFDGSVAFLRWFSVVGMDYTVASVMICVVVPGLILMILGYHAFSKAGRAGSGVTRAQTE